MVIVQDVKCKKYVVEDGVSASSGAFYVIETHDKAKAKNFEVHDEATEIIEKLKGKLEIFTWGIEN